MRAQTIGTFRSVMDEVNTIVLASERALATRQNPKLFDLIRTETGTGSMGCRWRPHRGTAGKGIGRTGGLTGGCTGGRGGRTLGGGYGGLGGGGRP